MQRTAPPSRLFAPGVPGVPGPARTTARTAARTAAVAAALLIAACADPGPPFDPEAYRSDQETWRSGQADELTADDGWLTVSGLRFLTPGEHVVGSGEDADLRIPDRFPERAVVVSWSRDGKAFARAADGFRFMVDGVETSESELALGEENAARLDDRAWFWIHDSGERRALRLRDLDAPTRVGYSGRKWFPVDDRFRIDASFEPYDGGRVEVEAINIRGDLVDYVSDGEVVFDLDGEEVRMQAFTRPNGNLFFVFTDATSGVESYRAARFLTIPPPDGGRVVMDFNRAVNPPCGFVDFTTCPTPPPQNRLPLRIAAGEKKYRVPAGG